MGFKDRLQSMKVLPTIYDDSLSFYSLINKCIVKINEVIDEINNKQDELVSGENIKTINGNNILGGGNLQITETIEPYNSLPKMDGEAISGVSDKYARGDHVHPTDTNKQDVLISGTNIKTINNQSILGEGNINTPSGPQAGSNVPLMDGTGSAGHSDRYARNDHVHPTDTSRQEKLVSGTNIKTINGTSILGDGDIEIEVPTKTSDLENDSGFITDDALEDYRTSTEQDVIDTAQNSAISQQSSDIADLQDDVETLDGAVIKGVKVAGTELVKDADGKVDIPAPTDGQGNAGVVKSDSGFGVYVGSDGRMRINPAVNSLITSRNTNPRPITPSVLNFAVKSALSDANRISDMTDAEKQNACEAIGAKSVQGCQGLYTYGGKDLSQKYTIEQLHALVAANDFRDIQIGDYYPITLNGTYHDAASDTDKTISNERVLLEVAGINSYIREGNNELTTPHLCLISRDCLANTVQMRSENSTWYEGGDAETPWLGSAAFETLNNAEHGIVKLVEDVIGTGHIANMRYYAEKMTAGSPSAGSWKNRGKLWLPTESEVCGQSIHQNNSAVKYTLWNQLPLFAAGCRHIIKGAGNGGSRCDWWLSLAASATTFCYVNGAGTATYNGAAAAYRVPLCFLFT